MNKIPLNIVGLDGGVIIKKGGGGGVTIKNQDKSLEIVENGTTEVTADAGFTGLGKVTIDVNVPTSGGGGGSDMPVIGDGKTYLYITIAAEGRMDVPIYFYQTTSYGVEIDWGDGTPIETLSGMGSKNPIHRYAKLGDYVISLNPIKGYLYIASGSSSNNVMGSSSVSNRVYCNMLKKIEVGNAYEGRLPANAFNECNSLTEVVISGNITKIENSAFYNCLSLRKVVFPEGEISLGNSLFYNCKALSEVVFREGITAISNNLFNSFPALKSVVIPKSVTSIGGGAFSYCYSLSSINIPEGVTSIGSSAFHSCYSLPSLKIPSSVTSIGTTAFADCDGLQFCDFSQHIAVPSLDYNGFYSPATDLKIIVPDALYDEWIAATNWSSLASYIIKKSDWDAQS